MLGMFRKAVREEAAPVARKLAEVRGVANQTNRRLEQLQAERERELAGDGEAEARPAPVARPERPENPLLGGRVDAGARVRDGDFDLPVIARQLELDPAAVGRPAKRVREEVGDDLKQAV